MVIGCLYLMASFLNSRDPSNWENREWSWRTIFEYCLFITVLTIKYQLYYEPWARCCGRWWADGGGCRSSDWSPPHLICPPSSMVPVLEMHFSPRPSLLFRVDIYLHIYYCLQLEFRIAAGRPDVMWMWIIVLDIYLQLHHAPQCPRAEAARAINFNKAAKQSYICNYLVQNVCGDTRYHQLMRGV